APLPAFCLDDDDVDASLTIIASDMKSVMFCLGRREGFSSVTGAPAPARTKCAIADFAAATITAVPEKPTPLAPVKPPYDVAKLELPKGEAGGFVAALSPDGKLVAATSESHAGKLFIFDAATGKQKKVVTWSEADGGCMEQPQWIGANIYVQYNVCAGPGATGWIVSPAGKKLGSLAGVNPTNEFYPVGGTRYAFEDFGGSSVEIM